MEHILPFEQLEILPKEGQPSLVATLARFANPIICASYPHNYAAVMWLLTSCRIFIFVMGDKRHR
jgi:hypothetical protein